MQEQTTERKLESNQFTGPFNLVLTRPKGAPKSNQLRSRNVGENSPVIVASNGVLKRDGKVVAWATYDKKFVALSATVVPEDARPGKLITWSEGKLDEAEGTGEWIGFRRAGNGKWVATGEYATSDHAMSLVRAQRHVK